MAAPAEFSPDDAGRLRARREGRRGDADRRPRRGRRRRRALYVDVWVSMGDEDGRPAGAGCSTPYRLDGRCSRRRPRRAIALHCLPAHPGEEITEGVLYGARSAVWDQAENRLHAQKALMEMLARRASESLLNSPK